MNKRIESRMYKNLFLIVFSLIAFIASTIVKKTDAFAGPTADKEQVKPVQ